MAEPEQYFEYLKQRSWRALLYRRFYLYPRLCRHLRGLALDVGCGIGDMVQFRPNTIGADINPFLVEYCKRKGLDVRLMVNGNLPFENESFLSVMMDNVLEHISSPMDILGEIYRVLERGGRFVVGVPGAKGFRQDPDHKIYYDEERLVATLQSARFMKRKILYSPIRSEWLNRHVSPYCLYGVFYKT
jgi:SAM-dependent methyltransferase